MSQIAYADEPRINPLDVVERLATGNDWSFERASDDEITILVTGRWTDYQLSYTWMGDIEALHLACAFDLKVPERRRAEVQALISLINEQLWVGHFDLWIKEGIVMFRHALVLAGGVEASGQQCEALLVTALDTCERYFTAFQFVVWAGKTAREALDAAMFETSGEAYPPCHAPQKRGIQYAERRSRSSRRLTGSAVTRMMTAETMAARKKQPSALILGTPGPGRRRQDGRRHARGLAGARLDRARSWCSNRSHQRRQGASPPRVSINPKGKSAVAALVIAVKPQTAPAALPVLAPYAGKGTLALSIMAGRTLGTLQGHLRDEQYERVQRGRRDQHVVGGLEEDSCATCRRWRTGRCDCSPRASRRAPEWRWPSRASSAETLSGRDPRLRHQGGVPIRLMMNAGWKFDMPQLASPAPTASACSAPNCNS